MILSLLINVLIDTDARPTRAYRILAWMIDAVIAVSVITVLAQTWMWLVDLINYVKWGI